MSGIDGIGKHPKQNIDCEFNDQSVDLRILSFNNKNLRLKISPLNGLIDPAECKLKVKSNSITIEMKKAKLKHWDDIKETKPSASDTRLKNAANEKEDPEKDPSASLMSMMKDLYDKGDDQMKRTIAESWEKAQKDKVAKG